MKVADVMSTHVDFVSTKTKVKDVSRLIFGAGINGIPVCEGKKVIGFVTEKDILSQFFPSIKEFVETPLQSGNFEEMEKKINEILNLPVKEIMSGHPTLVTPDTPILKAEALMLVRKIGRLPVVDSRGRLIGIISKGDIFRAVVGNKLPTTSDEEYHDWLSRHYDIVVDWKKRLKNEIPGLVSLFNKKSVKNVLDIGFGTGEHDIALAKVGFNVTGVESSRLMLQTAKNKLAKLPTSIVNRLKFLTGDYSKVLANKKGQFQAAIFLGNAFPHTAENCMRVLSSTIRALEPENSVLVFQIINYEKVFKKQRGFLDVNYGSSNLGEKFDHAFLEFYDPRRVNNMLTLNMEILDYDGKKWKHRSLNSTKIAYFTKERIEKVLKKYGYGKIKFYGGKFMEPLFKKPFVPLESDWLNVIAMRK